MTEIMIKSTDHN